MNTAFGVYNYFYKNIYRIWHWETWHWLVKYIPIFPVWFWYCFRARSFWFFTASNPTLTFGGFEGESKKEMYDQLPPHSYPKTFIITHPTQFSTLERLLTSELSFPVAVKPDVARMGLMFRKINSFSELQQYHERMKADYILQEFVDYPLEVSVFYYRFPHQASGTITGFIKKEYLNVIGDGRSTLWELMLDYPRVRFRLEEMKLKHAENLNAVIPSGEQYLLSHALNLSRGGKLVTLEHEKDEKLVNVFDDLSHYSGHFYFGRYDIKCASIQDLKEGRNFYILEFNGGGAEPHHVYGNGNTLTQALKILVHHWTILFKISRANNKNGISYWSFKRGYIHLKKAGEHFRLIKKWDSETSSIVSAQKAAVTYFKPTIRLESAILGSYVKSTMNRNTDDN